MSFVSDDEVDDELLAEVQEENLRQSHGGEQHGLRDESLRNIDFSTSLAPHDDRSKRSASKATGVVSIDDVGGTASGVLCTQVGGKAGALLFEGNDAKGFHLAAGTHYIYPTNYPVRPYQAKIVRSALFKNTLVSLPTGLGKTFIAAVVMYNFYRWYPRGKVVFMAPTRPLVAQQIKACYSIMGIPPDDTVEMTGAMATEVRQNMWKEKRVYFLTPQVMANDLRTNICPASLVKCVVFDEAHKAVKDFAYCQVVKLLAAGGCAYRTLALSATPGNDINAVIQVIRNLNISCLEMRGEDALDVAPYSHGKSIENVVVDLSAEVLRVKDDFLRVYEKFARSLIENRALTSNIAFLSKFQILKSMEKFRANPPRGMSTSLIGSLVSDFTMCMTLAHALELLQIYGLRAFYRYLADESGEKSKAATTRLRNNEDLQQMLRKLHDVLYPKPGSDSPYTWGHPKLKLLVSSLSEHFKCAEEKREKTKAIIFCQYKVVVNEIVDLLNKCKPHVLASVFIGQSGGKERGMPQSKQLQIMKDFRDGKINCLVATCVAEEGLDIGEVDLIVLMEAFKSPVRLVQRLGRTGRKRRGRCIVLLTRGKEEGKFHEAMASRKSYVNNITNSKAVKNSLCQYCPPMIPPGTKPEQQLVHIKVTCVPTPSKPLKSKKKQMDIRECAVPENRPFLNDEETQKLVEELGDTKLTFDQLPRRMELHHRLSGPPMSVDELLNGDTNRLSYWNDWNSEVHQTFVISSASPAQTFCHLMSYDVHREEDKYLKLIEVFESSYGGQNTRENCLDQLNTAKEKVNEQKKKTKKKIAPKKNFGVDIRSCMAAAFQKGHKRPRLDSTEGDDCLLIGESVGPVAPDVDFNSPGGGKLNFGGEPMPSKLHEDIDIATIFGMGHDEFENLLYSENMLCGLEADVGMCIRLGKIFGDSEEKLEPLPDVGLDVFKFQCDQLLKLMDTVNVISLDQKCRSPKEFHKVQKNSTSSAMGLVNGKDGAQDDDSFVGIDDLFGDDDDLFDEVSVQPVHSRGVDGEASKHTEVVDIHDARSPKTPKCSIWDSNSVFAELSPIGKSVNIDKPIMSSTPIIPRSTVRMGFQERLLDDIVEDEELDSLKPLGNDHRHDASSSDIFASTVENKGHSVVPVCPQPSAVKPTSDSDEDLWCLDDLFEDDEQDANDPKNETSCYGITQMVSQIEREKLRNQRLEGSHISAPLKNHEALISVNSPHITTDSNTNSNKNLISSKVQENPSGDLMELRKVNSLLSESVKVSKVHVVDSESAKTGNAKNVNSVSEDGIASKASTNDDFENSRDLQGVANPRSEHENNDASTRSVTSKNTDIVSKIITPQDGIIVIDSDSCSPPTGLEGISNISDRSKKSNDPCIRLLDEDDDVFMMYEETTESKPKNVKKFKPKSLLTILDSEDENDFPPEQHDKEPDETFALKVGCSSKRKLSFEDLVGEETSKYFSPKRPANCSLRPLVDPKNTLAPLQASPPTEDVFVNPKTQNVSLPSASRLPGKFIGGAQNDTSASSSSPVKPLRKPKHKKSSKKKGHAFIEREADESGIVSTDDSDNSSLSDMDDSFVNDASEPELSYAHYLKTIKSPVAQGRFKIPENRRYLGNVYSQVVDVVDDEYENDSFCVGSDEGDTPEESTILGLAERKLAKKTVKPKKKRMRFESSESDVDDRVADLEVHSPVVNPKLKRCLLESDSDVTPERPLKRPRNPIVSPVEMNKTARLSPTATIIPPPEPTTKGTIVIDSDSDSDLKEAIRLSAMESAKKKTAEEQFEEDLQKALFLSQCEVAGPSTSTDCQSPADRGTSYLFTSQPLLVDRKLSKLSTKTSKTAPTANQCRKNVFVLSDSD